MLIVLKVDTIFKLVQQTQRYLKITTILTQLLLKQEDNVRQVVCSIWVNMTLLDNFVTGENTHNIHIHT